MHIAKGTGGFLSLCAVLAAGAWLIPMVVEQTVGGLLTGLCLEGLMVFYIALSLVTPRSIASKDKLR